MQTMTPIEGQLEFDRQNRAMRAQEVLAQRANSVAFWLLVWLPFLVLTMFADTIAAYVGSTGQIVRFFLIFVLAAAVTDREIRVLKRKVAALTELVQDMRKG